MAAGMGVRAASALYAFLFLGTVTGTHNLPARNPFWIVVRNQESLVDIACALLE